MKTKYSHFVSTGPQIAEISHPLKWYFKIKLRPAGVRETGFPWVISLPGQDAVRWGMRLLIGWFTPGGRYSVDMTRKKTDLLN